MKITPLLLLLICIPPRIWSQLSGRVVNSNNQPVSHASVQLIQATDSGVVKATATNEQGIFTMESLPAGRFILMITCIGYQTTQLPAFDITPAKPVTNAGTIVLIDDQKQLQAVVVKAGKPVYQQNPEGITVNVENSVLSKGSTALEILVRSPGVAIDYRNNSISLNGKSGVQVMINGKLQRLSMEQLVQLLNGMSGNDIEKIELLNTPSVQYDAEGSAGIINIVLKKNRKRGTNGTLTVTGGYGWGEKGSGSVQLGHNSKKWNLFGSWSYVHDRTYADVFIDSWQHMPVLGGDLHVLVWDTSKSTQNNHAMMIGAEWKSNARTTIGSTVSLNSSARTTDDYNFAHYIILPDSLTIFDGHINGTNHWNNLVSSFYIDRDLRTGEKLHMNIDHLYFNNDNPTTVESFFVNKDGTQAGNNDSLFAPSQRGFGRTAIHVGVVKLDYTRQLNTRWKLETGVKGTYTNSISESGIESMVNGNWIQRSETIDHVIMNEGIGAAYGSVTTQLSAQSSLVMGLRYEYAFSDMKDPVTKKALVARRQGVFFPGITFSRKLNTRSELQLSWTKRISRPSYNDLASFVRYADPSAVFTGNPLLKSTITNNIKLNYNYDQFTFSLLFSRDKHPIARYMLTESPQKNLLYVSPQNLQWLNNITLQANLPVNITKWWTMNWSMTGGWYQYRIVHTPQPFTKNYVGGNASVSQSFTLPRRFLIELSGWYNSVAYGGTVKVGSMGAVNMGIKNELKNNGGVFQLSVTNLLRTMQVHSYFGAVTTEVYNIRNYVAYNVESRVFPIVKLTFTKSFGTAVMNKRVTGQDEERERIRKE